MLRTDGKTKATHQELTLANGFEFKTVDVRKRVASEYLTGSVDHVAMTVAKTIMWSKMLLHEANFP